MVKKRNKTKSKSSKKHNIHNHHKDHPVFGVKLGVGQKAADVITKFGGSWTFISIFGTFLVFWMGLNSWYLLRKPFDPFPFILLNLVLSCLAAIQAPIILMSQNRQYERDKIDVKYNYQVNRKAEREIQALQKDIDSIRGSLRGIRK